MEVQATKSLDCCEWSIKGYSGEGSEEETCRKSPKLLRDNLSDCYQNAGRNTERTILMNSQMEMKNRIGNWHRSQPGYKVAKNLAELCLS